MTFTILLPHKRNPGNNAALQIALSCLTDNTHSDFILLMDAAYDKPLYERVNAMVKQATTDCCVYWSSDMFAAPGWDTPMSHLYTPDAFVTNILVEPGAIGMHHNNLHMDFGRKPETFQRQAFEDWCVNAPVPTGDGWFAPYMFSRSAWLKMGGYKLGLPRDHHGFTGADELLFERWTSAGNRKIQARSYTYHLQRWSEPEEQEHEKRDIQS